MANNGLIMGWGYSKWFVFSVLLGCLPGCSSLELLPPKVVDVIVIGGGTGGTAAAIQAARMGVSCMLVEETPWLGGMLTAAGVSAIDGNHQMPAGLWGEFRDSLYAHYGGPEAVATGWVSHTHFEPHIGARIFENIVKGCAGLTVWTNTTWQSVIKKGNLWEVVVNQAGENKIIVGKILIDGTDLGDVAATIGAAYDLGMDSRTQTKEPIAPLVANNIIQDFTYCAILKDYENGKAPLLPKPTHYDPSQFHCACQFQCDSVGIHPCATMMSYAKLPGEKYLINWPINGNDYYAPIVEMNTKERLKVYQQAKEKTLQFVYFIQNDLGYQNLGLANDEFPTADQLPLIPYHREGRRIKGKVRYNLYDLKDPLNQKLPLFKTGIAVGDYPIDHHHGENTKAPAIDFPPVPSFTIPLGALIPDTVANFLVADKAISVSNIVNGSTRLQPVILQVGQAAGIIAALAVKGSKNTASVAIREVQHQVLHGGGYLMPYVDVSRSDPDFKTIHRIGATGLLFGEGRPYKWANQTWFYPDTTLRITDLVKGLQWFDSRLTIHPENYHPVTIAEDGESLLSWSGALNLTKHLAQHYELILSEGELQRYQQQHFPSLAKQDQTTISRRSFAKLVDELLNPFDINQISMDGQWR